LYINKGKIIPNKESFAFFCSSAGLFIALFVVFRLLYGHVFAYEWALYHLGRKDPRHSQSVFWMRTMYNHKDGDPLPINLVTLIFRISVIVFISFKYKANLFYAIFLITIVFTVFNTVYTAQYAIWEIQLFPLIFSQNKIYDNHPWKLVLLLLGWFVSMEVSVIPAGMYEGGGKNTLKLIHYTNIFYMFYRLIFTKILMNHAEPISDY
jgi:hypothetical protein